MRKHAFLRTLLLVLPLFLLAGQPAQAQSGDPLVVVLTADGPVTPAMAEYLSRGISVAERDSADIIVFQLNTPGGSVDVMDDMSATIRNSVIPVIVYVAPRGAIAGSAGTVITLAGHISAMAPETAIGAASPVGAQGEDIGETMEEKVKNVIKARIRNLMEGRSSEAIQFAESTVDEAKAATAKEALEIGMIDLIAEDLDDLLHQVDGRTVVTRTGERTIRTQGAEIDHLPLSLMEQLLMVLTNPNIVFLLLTIGVQAILIELNSPGGWVAGFVGAVSLALALYGLGLLDVNWFGLIILAISFVLFILDIKAPTHGALTAAGIGTLIWGALVLFNSTGTPSFLRVSVPLVVVTSVITAGTFAIAVNFAIRAQRSPIRTGRESLVGRFGYARDKLDPKGQVQVGGETWMAELAPDQNPLEKGARVRILEIEGIRLIVAATDQETKDS